MTGLAAGDLNRQITIRKRGVGVDVLNRPNAAFEDFATTWASHRTQTGMGRIAAEGVTSMIGRHSWRIRYRTDITLDMIVVYEGQQYVIVDVSQDLANKDWTDLITDSGVLV